MSQQPYELACHLSRIEHHFLRWHAFGLRLRLSSFDTSLLHFLLRYAFVFQLPQQYHKQIVQQRHEVSLYLRGDLLARPCLLLLELVFEHIIDFFYLPTQQIEQRSR